MYYPYFRGKQFELIALRELVDKKILSSKIIPIIEPVKLSTTLIKTIETFIKERKEIKIICNPSVGSLKRESELLIDNVSEYLGTKYVGSACILNKSFKETLINLENNNVNFKDIIVVHMSLDNYKYLGGEFESIAPLFSMIPEGAYRRKIIGKKVLFEDRFIKKQRNADYLDDEDEFFSDDHLYFSDEGYTGFSDYTIVGSEYSESGFLPYAVAIHLTYIDDDNSIRIRHFVSDSNEDPSDVPNKFYEALEKLIEWIDTEKIEKTYGIKEFIKHYEKKTFPGLGTIKKISIMHHLELVGKLLDEA